MNTTTAAAAPILRQLPRAAARALPCRRRALLPRAEPATTTAPIRSFTTGRSTRQTTAAAAAGNAASPPGSSGAATAATTSAGFGTGTGSGAGTSASLGPSPLSIGLPSSGRSTSPAGTHRAAAAAAATGPARLPEFDLAGKVILVSGAARGLGLVQAEALLEAGATVYALDRLEEPSADFGRVRARAAAELGTRLEYRRIDVRDVLQMNEIVEAIATEHGRLDGLLAAAGIQQETSALEYTAKDCDTMMSVNVSGCFMTAQAAAKQMIRFGGGGSIVMIASMSGTVANRGLICPAYNASKAAVIQLARNLAAEWGEYGIRVNTISPGYIVTAMVEALFVKYPERRDEWPRQNMLGRLSRPEEYRGAAAFLLSDASSFMTGSDLRMDGGHAAW